MKKIFSISFMICICIAYSQQYLPIINWQKTIGGSNNDYLYTVTKTNDGGSIFGGYSLSGISGSKTENNRGLSDFWVVKIDVLGNLEWQKTIGGSDNDILNSIIQTTDGGYLLGGNSYSNISGDKTENSKGLTDFWIIKLNSNGVIEWQKTIGGSNSDYLYSITKSSSGGYVLGGTSNSNISGDKTENSFSNSTDYWIVKINNQGNIIWQNTIGGNADDVLKNINSTNDGGYIISGSSNSSQSTDKSQNSKGSYDYWIVKVDSMGSIKWEKTIGGSLLEGWTDIKQTNDNGYILGGSSKSNITGDKTENSFDSSFFDYWVVKLSDVGLIQWQKTIGGSKSEELHSINQTIDGGYIIGGTSNSNISGNKTDNTSGSTDYYAVKLSNSGIIEWQKSFGGSSGEGYGIVIQEAEDKYLLAGYSPSNISGDKTENTILNSNKQDFWLIKIRVEKNPNYIFGRFYNDINNNNKPDLGDIYINDIKIQEIKNSITSTHITNDTGKYHFLNDTGIYIVRPISNFANFQTFPISQTVSHNNFGNRDTINFKLASSASVNDASIFITNTFLTRPNRVGVYIISYTNESGQNYIGTIKLKLDSRLTFQNSTPSPSSIIGDTLIWNIVDLPLFTIKNIKVNFLSSPNLGINDTLMSYVKIYNTQVDVSPSNNQYLLIDIVRSSYDPNNKEVDKTVLLPIEVSQSPYLFYTIRFQNVGNDTAFDIYIKDTLDNNLDWETFQPITSSHRYNLEQTNNKYILFDFKDIKLVDSLTNEIGSHGFITYKIKTKNTITQGASIYNKAYITFDVNSPIITNNAITVIKIPTTTKNNNSLFDNIKIFPNPTNDFINIQLDTKKSSTFNFQIISIDGRIVLNKEYKNTSVINDEIDFINYPNGVYMFIINMENEKAIYQIVKR